MKTKYITITLNAHKFPTPRLEDVTSTVPAGFEFINYFGEYFIRSWDSDEWVAVAIRQVQDGTPS